MITEWRAALHLLIICSCLFGVLAGTKRSSCNKIACPKTKHYVCASDGKTYRNECQLQKRACKGPHINLAHEGRCGTASSKHELVMEGFEWGLASKRVPRGSPSVIIVNVSAILEDNGGRVNGINLWRLGLFGSKWNDGWGERKNEVRQILTPFQQNRPARGGTPLNFIEVEGEFDYTTLGCDNFRYICLELAKGDNAEPDFQLRTFTMQDSLIICEEVPCQRPGHHQSGNNGSPSCALSCPYDYAPVCGTDGQTYPNSCEIENQIRCSPGSSLEIVFEDACDAGVTITSIFWSVEATNYVSRGRSELLLDAIVITEGTLDVSGTDLWRMGLFGSQSVDGSGPRLGYQYQILNSTQADMSLEAALPINLHFLIPVEFNVGKIGCSRYKFFCLEFSKGNNATPDFPFRSSSGKAIFVGCRSAPCNGPEGDGTGRLTASIRTFGWGLRASGSARPGEPSNVRLTLSVPVLLNSNEIHGRNLWRVGMYGNRQSDGTDNERFSYVRQTITDQQVNSSLIPGTNMEFTIDTQFVITGVGCGDYAYLCVEFAQADNPEPDFLFNPDNYGEAIVNCQRVPCRDENSNSGNSNSGSGRRSVARLANLNWNLKINDLNFNSRSNVTLQVTVIPDDSTDSIAGEGLWRLGIFFSTQPNGQGDRHKYDSQILPEDYADWPLAPQRPMIFLDVYTPIEVTGLGCHTWRYICIEFAKGVNPRPDFDLPLPRGMEAAVSCRSFPCLNGGGDINPGGQGGAGGPPDYNPNNPQGDGTGPETPPSASVATIRISNFHAAPDRVQFLLAVTPGPYSQLIGGEGLWRIGLYGSSDRNGQQVGTPHNRQVLNVRSQGKSLRPPSQLVFDVDTYFEMYQLGCGQLRYICIEFGKGDRPVPDFNLILPGGDTVVTCQMVPCNDPNAVQLQTTVEPQYQGTAHLARFGWEMNPLRKNPDGPSDVSFTLTITPQLSTDVISGTGLWRVGVFGSQRENGDEPRASYKRQVLNQLQADQPLKKGPLSFDVQTTLDMREMGCGPYKFLCIEFAKGDNPQPDFRMPLNSRDSLISCQNVPCLTTSTFLTTRGPPPDVRPHVIIRSVRPEEVAITEEAQNQLDIDVEIVYDQRSDEVTGANLWRLELWTSPKPDGSGTRLVSLDQALTDVQSGKALVQPYPFAFTNIRMNLDMRGNRCSYARYVCARLSNDPFRHLEPSFDLTAEPNYQALTGCTKTQCHRAHGVSAHPSSRPLVKFSGITVAIPTIEENIVNKLALRVNVHVSPESESVSGSQLWTLNVWGSRKANGGGTRYSNLDQALIPQQADMSVIPPTDLLFEYVRFDLDMSRAGCNDITYICVAISTQSTNFDLQGVPNQSSLQGCTTVTCQTASVPELVVNSVSIILAPTPVISGQSNPMTMDFEVVYDVSNSAAINGNNNWRVKVWGSDRANGGGPRISQVNQALTRQQAAQPLILGRPFTIRGIEYSMNLRSSYCRDVSFVCAQLVAGNNSFKLRPMPNKKSLISCQRIHCING